MINHPSSITARNPRRNQRPRPLKYAKAVDIRGASRNRRQARGTRPTSPRIEELQRPESSRADPFYRPASSPSGGLRRPPRRTRKQHHQETLVADANGASSAAGAIVADERTSLLIIITRPEQAVRPHHQRPRRGGQTAPDVIVGRPPRAAGPGRATMLNDLSATPLPSDTDAKTTVAGKTTHRRSLAEASDRIRQASRPMPNPPPKEVKLELKRT